MPAALTLTVNGDNKMPRYTAVRGTDKVMILDRKSGDAIGFVHSVAVAAQVVTELNNMERRGA